MSPSEWAERLDQVDRVVQSISRADFAANDKTARLYWWYYQTEGTKCDNWCVTLELVQRGTRTRAGMTITPPFSDEPRRITWWSQTASHERAIDGPPIPEAALLQYALIAAILRYHLSEGEAL